ncbi:MAG: DUF5658 family protein [Salinigranum sp.]
MSLRDAIGALGSLLPTGPTTTGWATAYESWLWLFVVVALTLDVATTTYGLDRGLSEANPIASRLFDRFGPLGAMLALKGAVVVLGVVPWTVLPYRYRGFVPLGVALPWAAAGVFNLAVLARFGI